MMDDVKHIRDLTIYNFKKFRKIQLSNVKLINVIGGDNNVGKTSLLESLLFDEDLKVLLKRYHKTLCTRGNHIHLTEEYMLGKNFNIDNYLEDIINWHSKGKTLKIQFKYNGQANSNEIELTSLNLRDVPEKESNKFVSIGGIPTPYPYWTKWRMNNQDAIYTFLYFEDMRDKHPYYPMIRAKDYYSSDLVDIYSELIKKDHKSLKSDLITELNKFDKNIIDIEVLPNSNGYAQIYLSIDGVDKLVHISSYGDGTVKTFRVLMEIIKNRGKRIMIDEIGDGIHFKRLKAFWKSIMSASQKYKTQIFASTHSLETLNALKESLDAPEGISHQGQFTYYELIQRETDNVKAFDYQFKEFSHSIETATNLRGNIT